MLGEMLREFVPQLPDPNITHLCRSSFAGQPRIWMHDTPRDPREPPRYVPRCPGWHSLRFSHPKRDRCRGNVQDSPEDGVRFHTLTVEEMIWFAAKTHTPHTRPDGQTRDEVIEVTSVLTTVFGHRHVRKALVGDARIRGVSGGEKK